MMEPSEYENHIHTLPRHWGGKVESIFIHQIIPRYDSVLQAHQSHMYDAICPSYSQLKAWKMHFDQYGETPSETRRRHKLENLKFRKRKLSQSSKISVELLTCLRQLMIEEPQYFLDEFQEALFVQGGEKWLLSCSTIWSLMVNTLGYTLRLYSAKAKERDENLRNECRACLMQWQDPSMFVFMDESNRGRNESRKRRAWAPRGQDNSLDEFFNSYASKYTYTLLAAADINGFIFEMTELVRREKSSEGDEESGTIDGERFYQYVVEKICPYLGCYMNSEARSIVVMDNATIHHDPRIMEAIEAAGARLVYTAPYSPDLMPIEFAFHQYKAHLRRHFRHGVNFGQLHIDALCSISRNNMINYYRTVKSVVSATCLLWNAMKKTTTNVMLMCLH